MNVSYGWAILALALPLVAQQKPVSPDVEKPAGKPVAFQELPETYSTTMNSLVQTANEYILKINQATEKLRESVCLELKYPVTCVVDWNNHKVYREAPPVAEKKVPESPPAKK